MSYISLNIALWCPGRASGQKLPSCSGNSKCNLAKRAWVAYWPYSEQGHSPTLARMILSKVLVMYHFYRKAAVPHIYYTPNSQLSHLPLYDLWHLRRIIIYTYWKLPVISTLSCRYIHVMYTYIHVAIRGESTLRVIYANSTCTCLLGCLWLGYESNLLRAHPSKPTLCSIQRIMLSIVWLVINYLAFAGYAPILYRIQVAPIEQLVASYAEQRQVSGSSLSFTYVFLMFHLII